MGLRHLRRCPGGFRLCVLVFGGLSVLSLRFDVEVELHLGTYLHITCMMACVSQKCNSVNPRVLLAALQPFHQTNSPHSLHSLQAIPQPKDRMARASTKFCAHHGGRFRWRDLTMVPLLLSCGLCRASRNI